MFTRSKHPMLFAVLIPENTSREIVYINKKLYVIARRRNADYVVALAGTVDDRSRTAA